MKTLWELYNQSPRPKYVEALGEVIEFKKDTIKFYQVNFEKPYSDEIVFHFMGGNGHIKARVLTDQEFKDLIGSLEERQDMIDAAQDLKQQIKTNNEEDF